MIVVSNLSNGTLFLSNLSNYLLFSKSILSLESWPKLRNGRMHGDGAWQCLNCGIEPAPMPINNIKPLGYDLIDPADGPLPEPLPSDLCLGAAQCLAA